MKEEAEGLKKIINDPFQFVDETLDGIIKAHPDQLKRVPGEPRAVVRTDAPVAGKVAIVTGGGSGHLPVFMGYVGKGLCHAASIGNVFSSPSANQMFNATRAANGGAGVLYLYGNYAGDTMNFDMAAEMAEAEGVRVTSVRVADDVASAPPAEAHRRRGVAGIFFAYKIAGAAAEAGMGLTEVQRLAEKTCARMRSMGVALSSCTVPAAGRPTFSIGEGEMEIGMGIHGEPGVQRGPLKPADEIADDLLERILAELPLPSGEGVAVLVNGLGATPKEELYILYRRVHDVLAERGVRIHRPYVGEYATSLEMAGASITVLHLDEELNRLLDAPAASPFFRQA